jgi:hypothetical protein
MNRFLTVSKGYSFGRGLVVSLLVVSALSACSWFRSSDDSSPKGEMRTAEGASPPKFKKPSVSGQGAPDLASVPENAPTAPSTKKEREKIVEGLVADRERAKYSNQESRIQPVNVRPLTEAAAETEGLSPSQAKGAPVGSVTKMQVEPGKAASADDLAKLAANTPPPPPAPDMSIGPAGPGGVTSGARVPQSTGGGVVRADGFRQLESYGAGSTRGRIASIDFGINSVTLTAADRRRVSDAAQLGKDKGTFRVVGRSNEASQKAQQRAVAVARELQNAGISQDRVYVGTDSGSEGTVDVMLDNK